MGAASLGQAEGNLDSRSILGLAEDGKGTYLLPAKPGNPASDTVCCGIFICSPVPGGKGAREEGGGSGGSRITTYSHYNY